MTAFRSMMSVALIASLTSVPAFAQSVPDGSAWRALAEQFEGGIAIDVRLRDGQHFKATFIAAHPEAMLVQRKTRIPVSVQQINYESIASLSRAQPSNLSAGKIAAIALGSAGAAVGVLWLIALATFD
jgi:uncharacterized protein (UPF0303 family)